MARWGMVIDTMRCIACYSCQISCKVENFLPPGVFGTRILIKESGEYPMVRKMIFSVNCMHCEDPACVRVCPTGATTRRPDGIVTIDYNKCMGCRYCIVACPYQQRYFYHKPLRYFPGQELTPYEIFGSGKYPTGVTLKCTFCADRVDEGIKKGLKPGTAPEATPACVNACPAKARYFGDLNDPNSEVCRLIRERRGFQLHPEYNTDPSVYYLA